MTESVVGKADIKAVVFMSYKLDNFIAGDNPVLTSTW
jgi:hypothetical protein